MLARHKAVACIVAAFAILAALIAVPFVRGPAVQGATQYGAGAGTSSNPTGGGQGFRSSHGYSQSSANYVVSTAGELTDAINRATSGQVIWIRGGAVITLSSEYAKTLKPGVALASNRGENGATGGKIKTTFRAGSFMCPILWLSSNCVVSGVVFEGPGGVAATSGPRNCALRGLRGAKRREIENCDIGEFAEGGIYFFGGGMAWNDDSSNGRHWIHHCYIHNMQKHGFGYGISEEGGCSYLVEHCIFRACRHHIMAQAGYNNYEVRYCDFGDSIYYISGKLYYNHQIDCHGAGASASPSAGGTLMVHHNTFSANGGHPNVGVRGIPARECRVYNNWTKKTTRSGLCSETAPNAAFTLLASGGSAWGSSAAMSKYNMYVYDNWYGTAAPSGSNSGGTYTPDTDSGSNSGGTYTPDTDSGSSSGSTHTPDTDSGSNSGSTHTPDTDSGSNSGGSTTITTRPAAPSLDSPSNGAGNPGTSVTFKWSPSTGATKYFLVVSTSPSLTTTQSNGSVRKVWKELGNVTQYTAAGFADSGKVYYWWVFSGNSYGWSTQAQVVANGGWKFVSNSSGTAASSTSTSGGTTTTITTKPAAPSLVSPANGARRSGTSATFKWSPSTGATKYFLVVSTSPSLTTTQSNGSVRKVWKELGNVTQYTAAGFADSGKVYYWWVFSGNSYGWSTQAQVVANGGWKVA